MKLSEAMGILASSRRTATSTRTCSTFSSARVSISLRRKFLDPGQVDAVDEAAAIAIPQFTEYTKKGEDKAAQSDAKNILTQSIANSTN
jgi:hypothetical protein